MLTTKATYPTTLLTFSIPRNIYTDRHSITTSSLHPSHPFYLHLPSAHGHPTTPSSREHTRPSRIHPPEGKGSTRDVVVSFQIQIDKPVLYPCSCCDVASTYDIKKEKDKKCVKSSPSEEQSQSIKKLEKRRPASIATRRNPTLCKTNAHASSHAQYPYGCIVYHGLGNMFGYYHE